mgnify:CR=1 FL=1
MGRAGVAKNVVPGIPFPFLFGFIPTLGVHLQRHRTNNRSHKVTGAANGGNTHSAVSRWAFNVCVVLTNEIYTGRVR